MLAIEILVKGTVLLALAFGLAAGLGRASAATRHLVWAFGLAGLVGLPLLTALTPWRLDVFPAVITVGAPPPVEPPVEIGPRTGAPTSPEIAAGDERTAPAEAAPAIDRAPTPVEGSAASGTDGAWPVPVRVLLAAWLLGTALVTARWAGGMVSLRRCVRRARPLVGPEWQAPLREAADRLLLDTPVQLLVSDRVPMPLTAGILRPVVVLPEAALEWTAERRQAVIVHELAHVRRKDALAHSLAWAACALWWFHPLVWAAARHLRAESERACDDLVLRAGTRASSYADHLLDIVCHASSPRAPAPAMPLAQRSEFEGRMLRILSPDARRHGLSALKALAVAAAFATVAVPLAAIGTAEPRAGVSEEPERGRVGRIADALLPDEGIADAARTVLRAGSREALRAMVGEDQAEDVADAVADAVEGVAEAAADGAEAVARAGASATSSSRSSTESGAKADTVERSRAAAALTATLRDGDAEVRKAAAQALGELDDPRAVEALMRALRTDPDAGVRKMAAWALGEIEDARAVPALGEALGGDASAEVRAMAAWALGEIESPGAVEYLRAAMRDSSPEVRARVIWALGQIEDPAAVPALSQALRDANVEVRRKAVWALGEIEDPRAISALSGALGDADAEVRSMAAWAIGEIQPSAAPAALIEAAGDGSAKVREHVAWALGEIEDPAAVPALLRLVRDPNAEVRKDAVWALTEIQAPSAYEALVELLNDESPEVRKAAARALGDANWDHDKDREQ